MLTSFNLSQLVFISAGYLLLLFGVAWISERGLIPRWIIRHPLTYTLSLGVYASAWAFYGTVGLAYQYGYGFLAIYLGISGAFLLAPVLLYPILRITRTYQLSSLADLFAFRFRSTWAGALTTIFMLVGVLPLLALQIQAVADSIGILTREPVQHRVALSFCALITLFTIFFGSRHIATREKHEGLVFAIAFESVIKLIAIGGVGLYALYGVFDGPQQLELWLLQNQTALAALHGHRIGAHFHGFLRVLERTDRGNAHHAGVLQAADHLLARRTAVADRPDFVAQHQLDDLAGIGLVHMEIHAERLIGQAPGLDNRCFHLLRFDGRPGEKTEATGIARGRYQFRVGDPAHGGLDDRVAAAEQFGQRRLE